MKINRKFFNRLDADVSPFVVSPDVSDNLQQTLSRLLGWHRGSEFWKFIEVDTDGRLLVSTAASQVTTAVASQVTVDLVSIQLLAANPNRRQYAIINTGANTIYLGFGGAAIVATGFPILPNGVFSDDVFVGQITAIASVAGNDVRIVEM